jgi:hypothetical protein
MAQKKRNFWKRTLGSGTSGTTALVGFALLLVLLLLAAGLLITLDTVIFRFSADITSLIGMLGSTPLRNIIVKILWLLELLLCGVLLVVAVAWGYQTAMLIVKPRQYSDRNGDDPTMRYLLATVAAIALVELLKKMST